MHSPACLTLVRRPRRDLRPAGAAPLGKLAMSKEQYKKHAEQCRELARNMDRPEDRAKLEKMAQAWDELEGATLPEETPPFEAEP